MLSPTATPMRMQRVITSHAGGFMTFALVYG